MKQIDVIFVTPLPAFYKVNLLNRLCEKKRVFVIFLYEMNSRRNKDFVSQGFVTPDGLKTFLEMGKLYEHCGGNDIYHSKLLPEVEALEIRYPDGSIYNKNN